MPRLLLLILPVLLALLPARLVAAPALDNVTFGLDWKAEAAYGGYYQAIAKGIYARHGLDVTIRQGGPQVNQAQLLLAGRLDFDLASNSFLALNFVQQKLPFVAVAAMFQKDPSVLIAHPDQGDDSLVAMRGKPIMISGDTRAGWWNFLRARFGYTDRQIRPYTFNLQPFLTNPQAIQQGYLMSEPFVIEQATHQTPVVLLLADAGFSAYGSLITTSDKLVKANPDLVQRFVDASIEGWYSYLYTDPKPGNDLIKQANPEITDALLAYGRDAMRRYGIVDSGDAATYGIGTMSATRWANFTGLMVQQKLYPRGLDPAEAYSLQFVNKRVGLPVASAATPPPPLPPPAGVSRKP
jgi:NitT/TauT family transport system substrate-binding protein